jgi:hypothetical protein
MAAGKPTSSLAPPRGPGPARPCGAEVVHNDHLARPQGRREHPLDVGLEDRLGRGTHHRHARPHPLGPHARQERRVLAAVPGNLAVGPLASGRPGPKPRHGRVSPAFVHEHQAPGIQTPYPFVPARPFGFVALLGREGLFLSGSPKRPKARLRLETESARPCSSSKSSRCSSSVRSGLRETWAGRAASSARPLCAGGPEGGLGHRRRRSPGAASASA